MTLEEKFWKKVDKTPTCWEWKGAKSTFGYGIIAVNGVSKRAHRVSYILSVGTPPKGLVLDHLCRNRLCVRPDHLEPVTNAENVMRGNGYRAVNRRKTHCPEGHPFDDENTYLYRNKRGCRACRASASRLRYLQTVNNLKPSSID